MDYKELFEKYNIVSDEKIMGGEPVIKGTRITVSTIIQCIKEKISIEDIMEDYYLTRQQVLDAIYFIVIMKKLEGANNE